MNKAVVAIGLVSILSIVLFYLLEYRRAENSFEIETIEDLSSETRLGEPNTTGSITGVDGIALTLFATSTQDRRAVIAEANADGRVLEPGDSLLNGSLRLTQVASNRVVLTHIKTKEIFILHVVEENGRSQLQKLSTAVDAESNDRFVPVGS